MVVHQLELLDRGGECPTRAERKSAGGDPLLGRLLRRVPFAFQPIDAQGDNVDAELSQLFFRVGQRL